MEICVADWMRDVQKGDRSRESGCAMKITRIMVRAMLLGEVSVGRWGG